MLLDFTARRVGDRAVHPGETSIGTPLISVVIPTFRRPQLLERCLRALLAQSLAPELFEIIVVDDDPAGSATRELVERYQQSLMSGDASTTVQVEGAIWRAVSEQPSGLLPMDESTQPGPHTHQAARAARTSAITTTRHPYSRARRVRAQASQSTVTEPETHAFPALHYVPADHTQGPAAARNLGWHAASAGIIAFTDDDCLPAPGWLSAGLASFTPGVDGLSGQVIVPLPERPTDWQRNTVGLEHSLFVTANCFYRKTALEAAGGFDERFPAAWREDSDLFFTLFERGYTLAQAPDAVVYHPARPEPWGASLRHQRKSIYNALLYKKHPALYRQHIQSGPPWRYYATLAAVLFLLAGLLTRAPLIAWPAGLAWLAFYLDFTARRLKGNSYDINHVIEMAVTSAVIPFLSIFWRLRGAIKYQVWFF